MYSNAYLKTQEEKVGWMHNECLLDYRWYIMWIILEPLLCRTIELLVDGRAVQPSGKRRRENKAYFKRIKLFTYLHIFIVVDHFLAECLRQPANNVAIKLLGIIYLSSFVWLGLGQSLSLNWLSTPHTHPPPHKLVRLHGKLIFSMHAYMN